MTEHTILVVDDSSTIRKIINEELTTAGYSVITAKNGIEALAVLEWSERLPDLITLDIDMPTMDGFEVCEQLRSAKEKQNKKKQEAAAIPILFVSANDTLENRRRGFRLEVTDFIAKPFKKGEIIKAVDKVLRPDQEFNGMTALVVDDSEKMRRIITSILNRKGLEVIEAANGLEALKIIEENLYRFDILIIDHVMPEMCGDELCSILQQQSSMDQVPKFFVSGSNDRDIVLHFFQTGATDYLSKPFLEEEFQARIETHLRARKYVRELQRLNKKLLFTSIRDSLTSLFNRGYVQEKLNKRFIQAQKSNSPFAVILIDIDYFKRINDEYGHAFGDLVLVDFSHILQTQVAKKHIVGRYGGEEFIILLSHTDMSKACEIADSIRKTCEAYTYTDKTNSVHVTVSAGVSALPDSTVTNPEELLKIADNALYKAKAKGRNRVCCHSGNQE